MIKIDEKFIDEELKYFETHDFDSFFGSDLEDVMMQFIFKNIGSFKLFCSSFENGIDQDPVRLFCKLHLRDFIIFVCSRYCSLSLLSDSEEKTIFRLQAELVHLIESHNIRYMNELKKLIKDDFELLDIFNDYEFNMRLKDYLIIKRYADIYSASH